MWMGHYTMFTVADFPWPTRNARVRDIDRKSKISVMNRPNRPRQLLSSSVSAGRLPSNYRYRTRKLNSIFCMFTAHKLYTRACAHLFAVTKVPTRFFFFFLTTFHRTRMFGDFSYFSSEKRARLSHGMFTNCLSHDYLRDFFHCWTKILIKIYNNHSVAVAMYYVIPVHFFIGMRFEDTIFNWNRSTHENTRGAYYNNDTPLKKKKKNRQISFTRLSRIININRRIKTLRVWINFNKINYTKKHYSEHFTYTYFIYIFIYIYIILYRYRNTAVRNKFVNDIERNRFQIHAVK